MYKLNSINKKFGRISYIYLKDFKEIIDVFKSYFTKRDIKKIEKENFNDVLSIHSLIIFDNYRKKGFGSKLLNEVIDKYKNKKCILIADKREDKTLPEFYKKNGFRKLFTCKSGQFMIRG